MRSHQKVLVLGATGSIGGAVAEVLRQRGHHVTCLARSDQSQADLQVNNFDTIRGDIRFPSQWIEKINTFDAVIQAAATWSDDEAAVDQRLVSALINVLASSKVEKTLIYTGGCWLYGETGDSIATEQAPYNPLPAFAWTINVAKQVLENKTIRGMVIHPAMVYERDGGVLEPMICDMKNLGQIRVVGTKKTRWTMVHRLDLAELYALVLENGEKGENYNGSSIESIEVYQIAKTLAKRFGISAKPVIIPTERAIKEFGKSWAEGYGLDQIMSSKKAINRLNWKPRYINILNELA